MADLLRSVGLNRYDLNARVRPALLVLLPIFLIAFFWLPQTRTAVGAIIGLLSACGFLYFMAQVARHQGRNAERKLGDRVGRAYSARLLLHADDAINAVTKARYHAYLRSHGQEISSHDEEAVHPEMAAARARSAVDWLLEHTRSDSKTSSMLLDENIAYGFRRNLFGMKPIAIGICIVALIAHGVLLWLRASSEDAFLTGMMLVAVLSVFPFLWTFLVTSSFVIDASHAYALRLFSHCEAAKGSSATRPRAAPKKKPTDTKPA